MRFRLWLLALSLWGCAPQPKPAPPQTARPAPPILGIEAAQVEGKLTTPQVSVTGTLISNRRVELASAASAQVDEVYGEVGQFIPQGTVVVRLRPVAVQRQTRVSQAQYLERAYQAGVIDTKGKLRTPDQVPNIRKNKGNLEYYRKNYQSRLKLRQDELISDQDVTDALHNYNNAKADYESSLENYHQSVAQVTAGRVEVEVEAEKAADYIVTAPFDSYVQERKVTVGTFANQGQALGMTLVSASPLFAELEIPQQQATLLRQGQHVQIHCDARPSQNLTAFVERVSPNANQDTRTIDVQARVESPPSWLKPGMFVTAQLQTAQAKEVLRVPDAAVLTLGGKSFVYVLKPQGPMWQPEKRSVQVGRSQDDWVEVHGVSRKEWVAASDLTSLQPGKTVKISRELRSQP